MIITLCQSTKDRGIQSNFYFAQSSKLFCLIWQRLIKMPGSDSQKEEKQIDKRRECYDYKYAL